MDRKLLIICLAVIMALIPISAVAGEAPPKTGEYVVGTGEPLVSDLDFEASKIVDGLIKIKAPLCPKEGKADFNWQLCASYAYYDGEKWVLAPQGEYALKTIEDNGYLVAFIEAPKTDAEWLWFRIWGKNAELDKWLGVNLDSAYCRYDTQDKPGYEFLIHIPTGDCQAPPAEYKRRK